MRHQRVAMFMKVQPLYALNGLLAAGAFAFSLNLVEHDPGALEWTIVGLFFAAVAWNVARLGERLYFADGAQSLWTLARTVLFWLIGLGNTLWARPEDVGGWRSWLGAGMLVIAALDSVALLRRERRIVVTTR